MEPGPSPGWSLTLGKAEKRGEKWRGLLSMATVWGFAGEPGQVAEAQPILMHPKPYALVWAQVSVDRKTYFF